MQSLGQITGLSPFTIVVRGTGNSATDDTNLSNAVTQLNLWGRGTLVIDGPVFMTATKNFTGPINLVGLDQNAEIISSSVNGGITWNNTFTHSSLTSYNISTAERRQEFINISGIGYTPASGDWIMVWSEDTIPEVEPHSASTLEKIAELHQVADYDPSLQRIFLADFVVDQISISGKLVVIPMTNDIVVENLKFSQTVDPPDFTSMLRFRACNNVNVRNIHLKRGGGGDISANYSANVKITDILIEGAQKNDGTYGVIALIVNGFLFKDSIVYGTRHIFTTGAGFSDTSPTRRYGTPLGCMVDNVQGYVYTKVDPTGVLSSRVGFDTHAEGWNVDFNNCTVTVNGDNGVANVGMQTRSRNTNFRNCRIIGNYDVGALNGPKGIRVLGKDAVIQDCYIEGIWRGIETLESFDTGVANRTIIKNTTFRNLLERPIFFGEGSGHLVDGCIFQNCANSAPACLINFAEGSGHMVTNCLMPKRNNDIAVHQSGLGVGSFTIANNILTGYSSPLSSGPLGFASLNGDAFETAFANKNTTGLGTGNRKIGMDALGNVSGAFLFNIASGYYDNKSLVLVSGISPTLSGGEAGDVNLLISQDSVGGWGITWGSEVAWTGLPVQPATGVFATTLIHFYNDGSNKFYGFSRSG